MEVRCLFSVGAEDLPQEFGCLSAWHQHADKKQHPLLYRFHDHRMVKTEAIDRIQEREVYVRSSVSQAWNSTIKLLET